MAANYRHAVSQIHIDFTSFRSKAKSLPVLKGKEECPLFTSLGVRLVAKSTAGGIVSAPAFTKAIPQCLRPIHQQYTDVMFVHEACKATGNSWAFADVLLAPANNRTGEHLQATEMALSMNMHFNSTGDCSPTVCEGGFNVASKPRADLVDKGLTKIVLKHVPFDMLKAGIAQHILSRIPEYCIGNHCALSVAGEFAGSSPLVDAADLPIVTNTVVAYAYAPHNDRMLRHIPKLIPCGDRAAIEVATYFDGSVQASIPPPPPGPRPTSQEGDSAGQVGDVELLPDAPPLQEGGGAQTVAVQDTDMVDTADPLDQPFSPETAAQQRDQMREEAISIYLQEAGLEGSDNIEVTKSMIDQAILIFRDTHPSAWSQFTSNHVTRSMKLQLQQALRAAWQQSARTVGGRKTRSQSRSLQAGPKTTSRTPSAATPTTKTPVMSPAIEASHSPAPTAPALAPANAPAAPAHALASAAPANAPTLDTHATARANTRAAGARSCGRLFARASARVRPVATRSKVQENYLRKTPERPIRRKSARPAKSRSGLWAPTFHT
jgi:hypothetical protein